MCGIVVVIGKNSREIAEKSIKKILHRGEDNYKVKTVNNISFAFTRLAINDESSKGDQPFEFDDYIGVSNAEIYNHLSLKKKYNLKLNSHCDTEVILPLYSQHKDSILEDLDGFYSSVIYDKEKDDLIIMRDYIGKKPLFFAYTHTHQYICSELKLLPNIEHFEIIPKGISRISKNKIQIVQEHKIKQELKPSSKELKKILERAIFKRVVDIQKNKIGIFLSGGLDSSIVAIVLSKLFPNLNIHYYSILDEEYPDYKYVKTMHKALNLTKHSYTQIELPSQEEFISIVEKVVYHTESYNPSIISNGIGTYLLSQEANKDGIKVVLTGDGADEMFMGYYDQESLNKNSSWKELHQTLLRDLDKTELRRVDLSAMANTIEIRCPFLDRDIYRVINSFSYEDFFGNNENTLNKNILREIFKEALPKEIYRREKVSFDVGSGLQKMMVGLCKEKGITEEAYLKDIWNHFFQKTLSKCSTDKYFYSYPVFDDVIPFRGRKYLK